MWLFFGRETGQMPTTLGGFNNNIINQLRCPDVRPHAALIFTMEMVAVDYEQRIPALKCNVTTVTAKDGDDNNSLKTDNSTVGRRFR